MPTPDPGGRSTIRTDALNGVACTSARDCWAVGGFAAGNRRTLNQALHWSGTAWSSVPNPNPAGASAMDSNRLEAIACTSSEDCWAVGTDTTAKATEASDQMLHWNGRKWKSR